MQADVARERLSLVARVDRRAGEVADLRELLGAHRLGRRERDVLRRESIPNVVLPEVAAVDR